MTFEFKYGPENSFHENYIVLPFDTQIKNTIELCDIRDENGDRIINEQRGIIWWDSLTQDRVATTYRCIDYINRRGKANFAF